MFPISDSARTGKIPFITIGIIVINILVFIQQLNPQLELFIIQNYALIPSLVNFADPYSFIPFVTAQFLHGGFFHILSNMWFLWVFGDNVEIHLGRIRFILLYIITGIVGFLAQFMLNPASDIPMIGASGAVSGLLAAYLVLFPSSKIKSLVVIFFFITFADIPAVIYIVFWFIIQVFSGVSSLSANTSAGGIAFWAHVAGFISGIFITRFFRNTGPKPYIEGEIIE